jgi:muconolactone delta-isomerase
VEFEGTNKLILYRGIILNPFSLTRRHSMENDTVVVVHERVKKFRRSRRALARFGKFRHLWRPRIVDL